MTEFYSVSDVADALKGDMRGLVQRLAGGRTITKYRNQLRIGSKGALAVEVAGRKQGTWFNHESSVGGGPIELIAHLEACSIDQAIERARQYTGLPGWTGSNTPPEVHQKPAKAITQIADAKTESQDSAREEARRAARVTSLWRGAIPLSGSTGERYLIETRRIPKPAKGWPQAVRWHPSLHALILAATSETGEVQAVQIIRLTSGARKAVNSKEDPTKQSFGTQSGAAVRLPGNPAGPLLFAEGPETGLSVWAATGYETHVAFGSIVRLTPPKGRKIVICRDDDARQSPADKALIKRVQEWRQDGHDITIATPWKIRAFNKSDFNDAIKTGGIEGVRSRIEAAITPRSAQVTRHTLEEARSYLDSAVSRFFDIASRFDPDGNEAPDVHALRVDVGVGKSHAARQHAARFLAALRAKGDDRSVVIAVPTHKLGDEQARAFESIPEAKAAGLTAAVWRGREALDPLNPGETMCQNIEAVRDAQEVLADPQKAVCRQKGPTGEYIDCPFFSRCGYQRQRQAGADLWLVPHELIYGDVPGAIGKIAALIVDESAWQDGTVGADGHHLQLNVDELSNLDIIGGDARGPDTLRLAHLRGRILRAIRECTDGPLPREALLAEEFTAAMAEEARKTEWMRKVNVEMLPRMTKEARKAAKIAGLRNKTIPKFNAFWRGVTALAADGGPIASGWLELAHDDTKEGRIRVLRIKGMKPINKGFQVPTLIMDATLQPELIKPIWPQVVVTALLAVQTPHQHVTQVIDRSYSLRSLAQKEDSSDPTYRRNNLHRLHAQVCAMARKFAPGQILVIAQKGIEESLLQLGNLPRNMELAHHNAIAGRDEWRDIAALVVIGRTQPPPAAVTRMAEALTGSHIPLLDSWYLRADAVRELADGTHTATEADHHPDPLAEAVRWSICEAELVQIIGRGRGVNRTAENPLEVIVMTDVPLPLPLAGTISAKELTPPVEAEQLAVGGIAFEGAFAAATAYPDLWPNQHAAKMAFQRRGTAQSRISNYLYGNVPYLPLSRLRYQLEGAGRAPAVAWFDPAILPDPVAWIRERIGALKWAAIDQPEPENASCEEGLSRPIEGLEPAEVYSAPMIEAPPVGSWRLPSGMVIEESRGFLVASPKTKPSAGQILFHVEGHPDHQVLWEWLDNDFRLTKGTTLHMRNTIYWWSKLAKDWPENHQTVPSRFSDLATRWLEWHSVPSLPVMYRSDATGTAPAH